MASPSELVFTCYSTVDTGLWEGSAYPNINDINLGLNRSVQYHTKPAINGHYKTEIISDKILVCFSLKKSTVCIFTVIVWVQLFEALMGLYYMTIINLEQSICTSCIYTSWIKLPKLNISKKPYENFTRCPLLTYGIHSFSSSSKQWFTQYIKGILSPWRPGMILYTWHLLMDGSPAGCTRKSSSSWWPGHSSEGQAGPQWNFTKGKFRLQTPSTIEKTWHNTSEGFVLCML